jgi:hypothetical protein
MRIIHQTIYAKPETEDKTRKRCNLCSGDNKHYNVCKNMFVKNTQILIVINAKRLSITK